MDTSTAHGEFIFNLFGSLAQYERALARERIMSGLESARKRGTIGGRPRRIDDEKLETIMGLINNDTKDIETFLKNLKDYGDNAIRYFRLTRFLYIRGKGFYVDLEPRRAVEIENLLKFDDASSKEFKNKAEYLNYISNIAEPQLPCESQNELIKIVNMKKDIIYNGDCSKILQTEIEENSIDLVFADPPYNLSGNGLHWKENKTGGDWFMVNEEWDKMTAPEYIQFTREWIAGCHKALKGNGSIYIACSYHNIAEVTMALKQLNYKVNNVITWFKSNAMPNMTRRVFTHSTEFVVWAVKGSGWIFNYDTVKEINPDKQKDGSNKQMRDLWEMPLVQGKERIKGEDGRALHPTQFTSMTYIRIFCFCKII